jgi:hypothetical protein
MIHVDQDRRLRLRLSRQRLRRHRARRRAGIICVPVLVDYRILDLLCETNPKRGLGWLKPEDAEDPKRIAKAISDGLARLHEGLRRF